MLKHNLKTLAAAAILGLCSATITDLRADDQAPVGVVRISDQGTANSGSTMAPVPENGYGSGPSCDGCNECQQGSSCYTPLCAMLHCDGVTYSPDHGFRRPVVEHIQRIPVEYRRYWPTKWYGEPGSGLATGNSPYPMVYTPTDTTQLGFYYQRVPQWRPNPGMIPPRPWPSQWHRREVCNNCNNGIQENAINQPQPAPAEPAPATVPQQQSPVVPPNPPAESTGPQAAFELPPAVEGSEEIETTGT